MKSLEILLNNHWIIKHRNPEQYYRVKDGLKECQRFIQEKLGYQIIVNPHVIKMEKFTNNVKPWMGIQSFRSPLEYQMLCYILMFLEDKEIEQQFVLSDISEFLSIQFEGKIDWTHFSTRKHLVQVMKYFLDMGMLLETDGQGEQFSKHASTEVLYEYTGLSRYYLRSFGFDILNLSTPAEFHEQQQFFVRDEVGIARRQRVYQSLLLCPIFSLNADHASDYTYVRNYRHQIQSDFDLFLNCELHVHKQDAFLVLNEMPSFGHLFPANNSLDEVICSLFSIISDKIRTTHNLQEGPFLIDKECMWKLIEEGTHTVLDDVAKRYRDMPMESFVQLIVDKMIVYGFLQFDNDQFIISPLIAKLEAKYIKEEVK